MLETYAYHAVVDRHSEPAEPRRTALIRRPLSPNMPFQHQCPVRDTLRPARSATSVRASPDSYAVRVRGRCPPGFLHQSLARRADGAHFPRLSGTCVHGTASLHAYRQESGESRESQRVNPAFCPTPGHMRTRALRVARICPRGRGIAGV